MEAGSLPRASQFAFAVTSEKNRKKPGGAGWGWTDRAGIKEHKSSFACALTSYRVSKGPAGEDAPSNSAVTLHPSVGIGFSEQATAKQMEDSRLASLLIPATVFS